MTTTPNLSLPYIDAAQAQKHVTHNEAIRGLDALVQTAIVTRTLSAPPATPADGACYILASAGTGAWAGQAANIVAAWQDGLWVFYLPKTGWYAWVADEATTVTFTGTVWQVFGQPSVLPQLGINATADATNKLAVKSPTVLFDNIGNGTQVKLNKHAAADTASLLYQDNFSGRAEAGLAGDDKYHLKVSADGATWKEALLVDQATGIVNFPSGVAPGSLPIATTTTPGVIKGSATISIAADGTATAAAAYTLPAATATILGGVKQGANLTIAADGTIAAAAPFALPVASGTVLGGIKSSASVLIAADGTATTAAVPPATSVRIFTTASDTLVVGDTGNTVESNTAAANTVTIPPGSSVNIPIGSVVNIAQGGAGATTLLPGTGVTIRAKVRQLKLAGIDSAARLYKRAADDWIVTGDFAPDRADVSNPTTLDDSTRGYAVGSSWVNRSSGALYEATSVAAGAAVWALQSAPGATLLDSVATAAAAYGVVKLRTAYAGNCLQVKRASDNTFLDIGFDGSGVADWASADTFIVNTTGLVSKWYDQSGNGLDAVQDTDLNAPVVNTGSTDGFRGITYKQAGGSATTTTKLVLPAGLSVDRAAFSAVMAIHDHSPANQNSCLLTLGTDALFSNNMILLTANTGRPQITANVFPVFSTINMPSEPSLVAVTSGAANCQLSVNDQTQAASSALGARALVGGTIGWYTGYVAMADMQAVVIYGRQLTAAEAATARRWYNARFKPAPQCLDRIVCIGDSITAGADADPAQPWSRRMRGQLNARRWKIVNNGASGQTAAWFRANFATNTATMVAPGVRNVLVISLGTNDLAVSGSKASAVYGDLAAIVTAAKAAGFKVLIATVLPRQNVANPPGITVFEATRQALNTLITANSAGADGIADIAGSAPMGIYANNTDTTLFTGSLHPTALGTTYLAPIYATAINALG